MASEGAGFYPPLHRCRPEVPGGTLGYGEGGPALAAEIVEARASAMDRRATESEFIRAALRHLPSLEAAVSNAMLDLASRAKNVPIYQLSGRTGPLQGAAFWPIWRERPPRIPRPRSNAPNGRAFGPSPWRLRSGTP